MPILRKENQKVKLAQAAVIALLFIIISCAVFGVLFGIKFNPIGLAYKGIFN